ncbi:sugar ABC transporter substrate-binding protein [Nitriliruptoraceae bacterium ZYF776]|nr:sugar ABC transporter substrate-binding protein [Profundirhabdus halotolerans]
MNPTSTRLRRGLATTAGLALLLAACDAVEVDPDDDEVAADDGGEDIPDDGSIVIGWTPPDITGVYQTATEYFEIAAEDAAEHGVDLSIVTRATTTHTDFGDQLAIVEDFISQGVDAIVISPAGVEEIKPAIQQATDAGIPVILVNLLEEQEDVDVASYIGFDNADAARVTAYSILDYFGGPGVLGDGDEVDVAEDEFLDLAFWEELYADVDPASIEASGVVIEGVAGDLFSVQRMVGFNDVMDQFPNVEILASPIAANWNREQGTQAAEDFLNRFGEGELDFIYAASNEMGLGAMFAADSAGRLDDTGGLSPHPEGTVAVFTNDVTPESIDAIRNGGIIAETTHGFAEWGWFGAHSAARLACGLEVETLHDIRPRTAFETNADLFYPEPELEELDWQEIADAC